MHSDSTIGFIVDFVVAGTVITFEVAEMEGVELVDVVVAMVGVEVFGLHKLHDFGQATEKTIPFKYEDLSVHCEGI